VIRLEKVSKDYHPQPSIKGLFGRLLGRAGRSVHALDRVDLRVSAGETVGILGGNGSGKTTLLKVVAGLLRPSSGSVHVQGRVAGLIELGCGFDPDSTGRENVSLSGAMLGLDSAGLRSRIPSILEFADLGRDIDRPVKEYSSGMFLRLAFAVAMGIDAPIVAVDEVLAVGDESFRKRCLSWLSSFRQRGGTVLMVSHDAAELTRWCHRMVWLENGTIRRDGPADAVVREYLMRSLNPPADENRSSAARPHARIVGTRVCDGEGRPRQTFSSDERVRILVEYEADVALQGPCIGVMISREDWTCCFATNTEVGVEFPVPAQPGTSVLCLVLEPLQLTRNRYIVTATLRVGEEVLDYALTATKFEVQGPDCPLGLFVPRHRWTLSDQSGDLRESVSHPSVEGQPQSPQDRSADKG